MERNRLHVRSPYIDRRRTSLISVASSGYIHTSASFGGTNFDAYYLILAWKAHEHIDFNFTVDANEHRTAHRGHRSAGRRVFRANAMPCFPMPSSVQSCQENSRVTIFATVSPRHSKRKGEGTRGYP